MKRPSLLNVFVSLLMASQAYAVDRMATVMDWVEEESPLPMRLWKPKRTVLKPVQRLLTGLDQGDALKGEIFTVVYGMNSDAMPIRFDQTTGESETEHVDVLLKAATVYYHMTRARNEYFNQRSYFKDPLFQNQLNKKVTVRIDINHRFNHRSHFEDVQFDPKQEDFSTYFSAALTVPPSDDRTKSNHVAPWSEEIWMLRPQKIPFKSAFDQIATAFNRPAFKGNLRSALLYSDLLSFQNEVVLTGGHPEVVPYLFVGAWSLLLTEAAPQVFKVLALFDRSYQQMDSALFPETSYHEYAHIVLGNVFGYSQSTALNEGFPNYFAMKISGRNKLFPKKRGLNHGFAPKKAKNDTTYSFDQDFKIWTAQGSFALGLLAELDHAMGGRGEEFVVTTLLKLKEVSREIQERNREKILAELRPDLINHPEVLGKLMDPRKLDDTRVNLYLKPHYSRAVNLTVLKLGRSQQDLIELWSAVHSVLKGRGLE